MMAEAEKKQLYKDTDAALKKGYELWEGNLSFPVPEDLRYFAVDSITESYGGKFLRELVIAAQSFFWFRYLHDIRDKISPDEDGGRVLLGDWFFSCFSLNLVPVDSTELINRFSAFLDKDINKCPDPEKFDAFLKSLPEVIESGNRKTAGQGNCESGNRRTAVT